MLFSSLRTVIPVCTCTICRGIGTLSWPPSPPLPPRALKGAARVPTYERESERDGPMLQKGTDQEAVRWMGWRAGDGAQNKRKAQNTMLRKERWTLCLLPLCSVVDARVCVCNALYVCTNIYIYIYIYILLLPSLSFPSGFCFCSIYAWRVEHISYVGSLSSMPLNPCTSKMAKHYWINLLLYW